MMKKVFFKRSALLCGACVALACASTSKAPPPIPEYASNYKPPIEIPEKRLVSLHQLMERSGMSTHLRLKSTASLTEGMADRELQKQMDRIQIRHYSRCMLNEVRGGPSYYATLAEYNEQLSDKDIEKLLRLFETPVGAKIRKANATLIDPTFSPEEQIAYREYKSVWDRQRTATLKMNRWLKHYDGQVRETCRKWFNDNKEKINF